MLCSLLKTKPGSLTRLLLDPTFKSKWVRSPTITFNDLWTSPPRTGHGHSHGDVDLGAEDGIVAMARGFLVVLALSIHDLFEGVALGVARS